MSRGDPQVTVTDVTEAWRIQLRSGLVYATDWWMVWEELVAKARLAAGQQGYRLPADPVLFFSSDADRLLIDMTATGLPGWVWSTGVKAVLLDRNDAEEQWRAWKPG